MPLHWRRRSRTPALSRSAGSADAFDDFYVTYAEAVVVFFARRTLDAELALDLTGETFALAFARRRQFRGHTAESERAWLFAIARTQLQMYWRRGRSEYAALRRMALDPPEPSPADLDRVEELADLDPLRRDVQQALSRLPDDQAYIVEQRVVADRSYAELAEELGVRESAVRLRVSRGLRTLSELLGDVRVLGGG